MPLNVRRFCASGFLVVAGFVFLSQAQTIEPSSATPTPPVQTAGDVMRERISKSKAFIAVRNYNAAIYELENIRRESSDTAVQGVVNVLLMNSYLEQGDYKRAQELLTEFYNLQKTKKPNAYASYSAVAGQVVKGARSRVERYRALGLSVSDRTLPLEALNDLEKMRETLELVITQSKEVGVDKAKTSDAMAMLEEASNSRSMLARDDYDSRRWKDEVADTREKMANSRSVVLSAVNEAPADNNLVAGNITPVEKPAVIQPVADTPTGATRDREVKQSAKPSVDNAVAQNDKPVFVPTAGPQPVKNEPKPAEPPKNGEPKDVTPMDVGSLLAYATRQQQPVYPAAAKSVRATGIVKVEVTVSETGDVSEVHKTSGPSMLQAAAKDAIRKWKFRPFTRDGQPVKATGFVSFNFAL